MNRTELYRDIAQRTNGEIYIGVVGPVRTGKSTFIKRFMDVLVLPEMQNEYAKERLNDELPQSGAGRTIMTTQPNFVPNEAAVLDMDEHTPVKIRMVDCVGYMIPGATGHQENDSPRMVRTPWYDYDIPFEEAAEIGTKKVITEHSTIGVVVTTDGSITQIERENYVEAEERVIHELKQQGKPFIVLLNSASPNSDEAINLANNISNKYSCSVYPADVLNMSAVDMSKLLELVLMEFPIRMVKVAVPNWMTSLSSSHWLVQSILEPIKELAISIAKMKDNYLIKEAFSNINNFEPFMMRSIDLGKGIITVEMRPQSHMFYKIIGEECGYEIKDDAHLIASIKEFVAAKKEYDKISGALSSAYRTGYGMVAPELENMTLEEPDLVQQGSRFGVKLKAKATGLHLIKVDVETEVSPLVGTEEQSEEFLNYLRDTFDSEPSKIWDTNIFGKPLHDLVRESMQGKVNRLPDDVQFKLQETLQRMVNDGCNGLICILL